MNIPNWMVQAILPVLLTGILTLMSFLTYNAITTKQYLADIDSRLTALEKELEGHGWNEHLLGKK